ncbi:serine/threonine-protein kinase [Candidatus Rhodoblastus alkanivorans]|uniref:Serine/threonine protein kinase n=1 Tax=Candidatus Rhodoblastus alkanivorans TaxID=2954117 RepID=A0ABS9Z7D3_9HYPH|nr:serine/threonine-protein kinase [Candidatus Rhodoblastus alkanivorans]MCI4683543.1 serine/threonine protein kinase [Candidatus Rhodoblastus alkanivorans]
MTSLDRPQIRKGLQLNGIYEIDEPLAAGGMGEVYRGHAIQTGDAVAIKLIREDLASDEDALAMFRREASALHSIHHEAIVRYFVFSVDPALKRPYLAMEFVEGEALSDILRRGRLPLEAILALKARVASGLESAHRRGVVHRDISPDNIIVPDGDFARARIIDFGIARSARSRDATVIGSGFAGKQNYVSPEQLGLFGGEVTARSDIYSLGLVLAYASCGRPLDMKGSQLELIEKRRDIPDLSCADAELRPLLERMLQPDPAMRPTSMRDIEIWTPSALPVTAEKTIVRLPPKEPAPPETPLPFALPKSLAGPARPGAGRIAAVGGIAAALALGGFLLFRAIERHRPNPPEVGAHEPESARQKAEAAKQAAAPPGPTPSEDLALDRARVLIARPQLGPCATLVPIEVSPARVSLAGLGLDAAAFQRFDQRFQALTGRLADISVREVTRAQCPAIDFLETLRKRGAQAPTIALKSAVVRGDAVFSGTVSASPASVELLVVDDDGETYNATNVLRGDAPQRRFAMRLRQDAEVRTRRLLLIAVASAAPFTSLRATTRSAAADLFVQASQEIGAHPQAAAAVAAFEIQ